MSGHQSINFLNNITSSILNLSERDETFMESSIQTHLDEQEIKENSLFMTKVLYLILIVGLTLFFGFLPLMW